MAVAAIVQGTTAWHDERRKGIGSSDAPVVMDVSPWKTPYQLWLEKTGRFTDTRDNAGMKRGRDMEAEAREAYELDHELMPPVFVRHPKHDFLIASLDGLSADGKTILEIKCPGAKDHATAVTGDVPAKYYPQIQHQLLVTGAERAHYWSYDGNDGVLLEVLPEASYIEELLKAEAEFWHFVTSNTEPPKQDRDVVRNDEAWQDAAYNYVVAKREAEALLADAEIARQNLIRLLGEAETAAGAGVRVTRFQKAGAVDYKAAGKELADILGEPFDFDRFRKSETTEIRVTVEKEA